MGWNVLFERKMIKFESIVNEIAKYDDILLNHAIDVFYILLSGCFISLVVLILEILYKYALFKRLSVCPFSHLYNSIGYYARLSKHFIITLFT